MKEVLIFDCFGVIVTEVSPYWLKRFFKEDEALIISESIIHKLDTGEYDFDRTLEELSILTNESIEDIKKDWLQLAHFREDLLEEIKKLRKKYKIVLLSNAGSSYLNQILERIDVNEYFDEIIISSDICLSKPNREIFEYALDKINYPALKCIFIDDRKINIEGAKKAFIDGILFENTEQFLKELEKY